MACSANEKDKYCVIVGEFIAQTLIPILFYNRMQFQFYEYHARHKIFFSSNKMTFTDNTIIAVVERKNEMRNTVKIVLSTSPLLNTDLDLKNCIRIPTCSFFL